MNDQSLEEAHRIVLTEAEHDTLVDDPDRRNALPFVIAVMTFLTVLAAAGGLALNGLAGNWAHGLEGSLTVEIGADAMGSSRNDTVDKVRTVLEKHDGIASHTVLDDAAMEELIGPWLGPLSEGGQNRAPGDSLRLLDLPLPVLIDVQLTDPDSFDLAGLNQKLSAIHVQIAADDHRANIRTLVRFAGSLQVLAVLLTALVALATMMVVMFGTRAALDAHKPTVELLHLIGATDRYIAREFERRFLNRALSGGILGLGVGALTLAVLIRLAPADSLDVWMAIGWGGAIVLALIPLLMGGLAMLTARVTVLRALSDSM